MSPKGQTQKIANQRREGMQKHGKNSQETTVQPWGRILVLPQGIHVTVFLKLCLELNKVPDELWTEVLDIVQETGIKIIPMEKK